MRRFSLLICALLVSWSAVAQEGVWSILQRVSEYMDSKNGYEVKFSIDAEGFTSHGRYCVKGDLYYISVADAEVYADGKVRYEVDNARREVNVDVMNADSHNILDNPTRCFDFVEEDYTAVIVESSGEDVVLSLRAKDEKVEGEICLTIDSKTACPKEVKYMLYDDVIKVVVEQVEHKHDDVKSFNRSQYKDYEIIDFR